MLYSAAISALIVLTTIAFTAAQQPAAAAGQQQQANKSLPQSNTVGSSKITLDLLYLLPQGVEEDVFTLNEANTFGSGYQYGWILQSEEDVPLYLYILYTGQNENRLDPFLQEMRTFQSLDGTGSSSDTDASPAVASNASAIRRPERPATQQQQQQQNAAPYQQVPKATLYVTFTNKDVCDKDMIPTHNPIEIIEKVAPNMYKGRTIVRLPYSSRPYFICMQQFESDENIYDSYREFSHQGSDYFKTILTSRELLPFWARIVLFVMLLSLSGLFSGLNLGLMSLDLSELEILKKIGKPSEKSYAEKIYPLRERGNFLLCTILLGNVLVNSTSTLILGDMLSGIYAALGSTLLIVIFGEIIPQAACSKHGLAVGAYTRYIMYLFMVLTCPLSWPLSKLLDLILGKEIAAPYSREKIRELMKNVDGLDANELQIISGALDFNKRRVREIMTPLTEVFMLEVDSRLDFETIARISQEGYSRIPVYQGTRENVIGLLHVKDFTLLDPDDNMPVKAILEFYNHPTYPCDAETTIDEIFEKFRQGETHLAFVRETITDTDKDPYDQYIGIVTLEDILEALVQMEIYDEFDDKKEQEKEKDRLSIKKSADSGSEVGSSKQSREHLDKIEKKKLQKTSSAQSREESRLVRQGSVESIELKKTASMKKKDSLAVPGAEAAAAAAAGKNAAVGKQTSGQAAFYESQTSHDLSFFLQQQKERAPISPQIRFVMFQFLFTTVKPMTSEFLTKNVLELIFKRAVIKEWRRIDTKSSEYLYEYGKGCNYFILILTGEATIEVGKEKLEFPAGPFAYFGVNALLCGCETADQVLQQVDHQKLHAPSSPSLAARPSTAAVEPTHVAAAASAAASNKQHLYVPDFSLRLDDRCVYMKLDRELWLNGVIKSRLEKQNNRASEAIELAPPDQPSTEPPEASRLHLPLGEDNHALRMGGSGHKRSPSQTDEHHAGKAAAAPASTTALRRPTVAASAFEKVQLASKAKMQHSPSPSTIQVGTPTLSEAAQATSCPVIREESASLLPLLQPEHGAEESSHQEGESEPFLKKE